MEPKTVGRDCDDTAAAAPIEPSVTPQQTGGLLADSIILTLAGEMRVGDLSVGDRVITRDCGTATIKRVTQKKLTARAILIKAGSLGHTRPERDVILPPGQGILVRDWRARALFGARQALVAAHRLIDGEFITESTTAEMRLVDIEFDRRHVLYVDGLELASHDPASDAVKAA